MIFVFWGVVALLAAGVHLWRHKEPRTPERVPETFLRYWLLIALGIAGIVGGGFHLFDGPDTAQQIGFTNGDGGFQTEVGFADIAVGVICMLAFWIRDPFWLAAIIAAAISLWGDGYGHIHQEVVNNNHDPDNTGAVLYSDFIFPAVAAALYVLYRRATPNPPPIRR